MSSSESETLSDDENETFNVGEDICNVLKDIKLIGLFITGGHRKSATNPGLCIPSLGTIGLPISADNTRAMIQLCNMSSYGKGCETIVNGSVRKSWQLDATQFSFQNPDWESQGAVFVSQAVSGLGLKANSSEIQAEPYKLLIYEEDEMFGTLIVCLPSKHEGGELIASHKDKGVGFATAKVSEFGFSWAAWYADFTHEVKPVTSGLRIVLVYNNLIHRPTARLLNVDDRQTKKLKKLPWFLVPRCRRLDRTIENIYNRGWDIDFVTCPPALVYTFEHQYTTAELSFNRLKGVDQSRFAELQDACQQTEFDIFLVNIEKEDTGAVDDEDDDYSDFYGGYSSRRRARDDFHTITDVFNTTLKLVQVIDRLGATVVEDLMFPENMLLPADVLDRKPDDESFQGFTGNEGASASHFYKETVGVLSEN